MNAGLDFALAQVKDRDLVIGSLREQLAAANETLPEVEAQAERERVRAEAAEAKLAEVEKERDDYKRRWFKRASQARHLSGDE